MSLKSAVSNLLAMPAIYDRKINVSWYATEEAARAGLGGSPLYIRTDARGVKPDVRVTYKRLPGEFAANFSVSIKNLMDTIDTTMFPYIRVEMGYKIGGMVVLVGEVFNFFTESPNPNGITTFQCVVGHLLTAIGVEKTITFSTETVPFGTFCKQTFALYGFSVNLKSLPGDWANVTVPVNKGTYTFASVIDVQNQVNAMANDLRARKALSALSAFISNKQIEFNSPTSNIPDGFLNELKIVSAVTKSASHVVITAPVQPEILLANYFKMDLTFYKGKIANIASGVGANGVFKTISTTVNFSTYDVNQMVLNTVLL